MPISEAELVKHLPHPMSIPPGTSPEKLDAIIEMTRKALEEREKRKGEKPKK